MRARNPLSLKDWKNYKETYNIPGEQMQRIPISLAAPGMILAAEVRIGDRPEGPPVAGKATSCTV